MAGSGSGGRRAVRTEHIKQINEDAKEDGYKVRLVARGPWLHLRAMLPPRPGSSRSKPSQQFVPLGLPAWTMAGCRQGAAELVKLGKQLQPGGVFDWLDWGDQQAQDGHRTGEAIARYREHCLEVRGLSPRTWARKWVSLSKLDPGGWVNADEMVQVIHGLIARNGANSAGQETASIDFALFCEWLDMDQSEVARVRALRGCYGGKGSKPKRKVVLPDDEAILANWGKIDDPAWQYCYALIATYGIRPGELFEYRLPGSGRQFLGVDLETLANGPEIKVWDIKAQQWRLAMPVFPEWYEKFELNRSELVQEARGNVASPNRRMAKAFRRWDITRLNLLRHSWNERAQRIGLSDYLAAKLQGHSVEIHQKNYREWIGEKELKGLYLSALKRVGLEEPGVKP